MARGGGGGTHLGVRILGSFGGGHRTSPVSFPPPLLNLVVFLDADCVLVLLFQPSSRKQPPLLAPPPVRVPGLAGWIFWGCKSAILGFNRGRGRGFPTSGAACVPGGDRVSDSIPLPLPPARCAWHPNPYQRRSRYWWHRVGMVFGAGVCVWGDGGEWGGRLNSVLQPKVSRGWGPPLDFWRG